MTPPVFIDTGEPGTWRDMIAHSPWLRVENHSGSRVPFSRAGVGEPAVHEAAGSEHEMARTALTARAVVPEPLKPPLDEHGAHYARIETGCPRHSRGSEPGILGKSGQPVPARVHANHGDDGLTWTALADLLRCSLDTIVSARDEKSLLSFDLVARLGYHFPDEFRVVSQLWENGHDTPSLRDELQDIVARIEAVARKAGEETGNG